MNEANMLLRRALEAWDLNFKLGGHTQIYEEIRTYLDNQEPKKPMTEEEMLKLILDPERKSLVELIRAVEKHHGIGEKE